MYLSGNANLINGVAEIKFNEKISEAIAKSNPQVIVTPVGSWSTIYVAEVTAKGFKVKSESGNANASFGWMLVVEKTVEAQIMR